MGDCCSRVMNVNWAAVGKLVFFSFQLMEMNESKTRHGMHNKNNKVTKVKLHSDIHIYIYVRINRARNKEVYCTCILIN